MFCPGCGKNCPDNAVTCPNCGRSLTQAPNSSYSQPYGQPYGQPNNYDRPIPQSTGGLIAWGIVTLLLCTIPGIVALVQASGINNCATRAEQEKKISSAKTWCLIGTILGGLATLLSCIGSMAASY